MAAVRQHIVRTQDNQRCCVLSVFSRYGYTVLEMTRQVGQMLLKISSNRKYLANSFYLAHQFDMRKLPLGSGDQPPRHGCSLEQAVASCSRVHAAIDLLVDEGIPPERIVVGGFSQGGAMSLLSALTYREKLGGIIVFSGIVFFGELLPQLVATRRDMRVFWGHGSEDELLKPSLQDVCVKLLSEAGLCITAKMYRVGHSSGAQEMEDASNFFSDILGLA